MADPVLEAAGLTVSFPVADGRVLRAVDGASFRVGPGQILGLVGESGCGKTTVARCMAGLLAPQGGTVRLDGAELGARRTAAQRRAIQMIFQDPYSSLLLAAAPRLHQRGVTRPDLRGEPPSPVDLPSGCHFHPRCPRAEDICRREDPRPRPARPGSRHIVACHFGADPVMTENGA